MSTQRTLSECSLEYHNTCLNNIFGNKVVNCFFVQNKALTSPNKIGLLNDILNDMD